MEDKLEVIADKINMCDSALDWRELGILAKDGLWELNGGGDDDGGFGRREDVSKRIFVSFDLRRCREGEGSREPDGAGKASNADDAGLCAGGTVWG